MYAISTGNTPNKNATNNPEYCRAITNPRDSDGTMLAITSGGPKVNSVEICAEFFFPFKFSPSCRKSDKASARPKNEVKIAQFWNKFISKGTMLPLL